MVMRWSLLNVLYWLVIRLGFGSLLLPLSGCFVS